MSLARFLLRNVCGKGLALPIVFVLLLPGTCLAQPSIPPRDHSPAEVSAGAYGSILRPLAAWGSQKTDGTLLPGVLYAVGANALTGSSLIFSIDNFASNPVARPIATFGAYLYDAAIDPTTQKLYVLDSDGDLYRIDLGALEATFIGQGLDGVNALVFDRHGQAFGWSLDRGLYRIDKNTGQATLVGDTGYSSSGDLAFDFDGTLFGTSANGDLVRINSALGTSTRVGPTGFGDFYGLATSSPGLLLAGRGSDLTGTSYVYRIDKATGRSTLVGAMANGNYPITGFALFDLAQPLAFGIRVPTDKQDIELSEDQFTATAQIEFAATGATDKVTWSKTELVYQTSGGRGLGINSPYRIPLIFETLGSASHIQKINAMGGQLAVRASATINGRQTEATPITVTVTGGAIPVDQITQRLVNLYSSGATPRLLTGLAEKESSYSQFTQSVLYGRRDLWPTESFDGGSHIGLAQLPTTWGIKYAWSWIENSQRAAAFFKEKLAIARSLEKKIRSKHKGLRELTSKEREDMALVLYGPGAKSGLDQQYYTAAPEGQGWKWVRNVKGKPRGSRVR